MQHSGIRATHQANTDWWGKLTEGVLAAVLMFWIWVLFAQVIRPVELLYGAAGLLVYILALIAGSLFALQQALNVRYSDYKRAWFGIAGGFLAWSGTGVSTHIGLTIPVPAAFVPLIMISLVVLLLWRSHLPAGARFYSLTFLANWAGFLLIDFQTSLAAYSPVFALIKYATGVACILLLILVLGWVLFQSQRRVQRALGALAMWVLGSIILYIYYGAIY